VNGNISRLDLLQDMGVQLVGQDAHDAVGEFLEPHRSEELDYACRKEQPPDVPSQNDAIEAVVFELDIRGELLHKGIIHGRFLPIGSLFAHSPYRTAREKSILCRLRRTRG